MASDQFTVALEGSEDLERALKDLDRATAGKALKKAVGEGAEIIRQDAASRAPRRTGHLSRNVGIEFEDDQGGEALSNLAALLPEFSTPGGGGGGSKGREARAHIGPTQDAYYGVVWELGGVHHTARPWLRPAFDANAAKAVVKIGEELRKRVLGVAL